MTFALPARKPVVVVVAGGCGDMEADWAEELVVVLAGADAARPASSDCTVAVGGTVAARR